jgi:hypothetical protein
LTLLCGCLIGTFVRTIAQKQNLPTQGRHSEWIGLILATIKERRGDHLCDKLQWKSEKKNLDEMRTRVHINVLNAEIHSEGGNAKFRGWKESSY